MIAAIILVFVIGYLVIVFEHPLKLDKTVPALFMGALMWGILAIGFNSGVLSVIDGHNHLFGIMGVPEVDHENQLHGFSEVLLHHLGKISEILIFLIGAMTIVELVDLHRGFDIIKEWIGTRNKRKLLWIIGIIAFVLSAIIDNLTATIVLISILRKIVQDKNERIWFVALIVIAANAGGAWSPIGDVTTTMLWIGKKVTTISLVKYIIIPSILCFAVPFAIASYKTVFSGELKEYKLRIDEKAVKVLSSRTMLFLGLGMIIFVPIFKTLTHLPPYVGMMLSLAVVWAVAEYIHPEEQYDEDIKHKYSPHKALSRIEISSILFFLGILMSIAAFESVVVGDVSLLRFGADKLSEAIPNTNMIIMLLGILSAVIDNVPLVAAAMGMFSNPTDDMLWHFLAFTAGTGGSMLIVGSAAGVAAMGIEKIDFIWYFKKITWLAAAGFFAGCIAFLLMH